MPFGTPHGWLAFTIKPYGDRPMPREMIEPHTGDPPPLKWSDLRYVSDIQEDYNGKEALQA